ncbi:MAG: chemotaxis protein CheD [Clostridia bacterium]|nr:chemotaxis protein CheD [Clostridia bacterium]
MQNSDNVIALLKLASAELARAGQAMAAAPTKRLAQVQAQEPIVGDSQENAGVDGVVSIGMGGLHVTADFDSVLVAYGLGSCVGVVIQDPETRIGGMAHVVLPTSSLGSGENEVARYADLGVGRLVGETVRRGGSRGRLQAKIAGGARMFDVPGQGAGLDIGARNAEAVRAALLEAGVPIVAADVGGSNGRTMRFHVGARKVYVRLPGMTEREL